MFKVFQLVLFISIAFNVIAGQVLWNIKYEVIPGLNATTSQQQSDNTAMASTILLLTEEVQLRQDITSLIVDAARAYNVDPKLLANLIKSESNFRPNIKHSVPYVECMAGINNKAHPKTLYNPSSITGCVYAAAEILAKYIDESDGLTLALTKYKGFSPLGHTQAKAVIKETYK